MPNKRALEVYSLVKPRILIDSLIFLFIHSETICHSRKSWDTVITKKEK